MSNFLFVHADRATERHVGDAFGFGAWSSAFPLILEKHGFLSVRTVPYGGLEQAIDAGGVDAGGVDALIAGWLPEAAWRARDIETIRRFPGPLLLEGPLPPALAELAGLAWEAAVQPTEGLDSLSLVAEDADLAAGLEARSGPLPGDGFSLRGRGLRTRPPALLPERVICPDDPLAETACRAALAAALPLHARLHGTAGAGLPDDVEAAGLVALAVLSAIPPFGPLAPDIGTRDDSAGDPSNVKARALRSLALAVQGGNAAPDPAPPAGGAESEAPWRAALLVARGETAALAPDRVGDDPVLLWLAWRLACLGGTPPPGWLAGRLSALVAPGLARLDGWPLWRLMLLAGTALATGTDGADALLRRLLDAACADGWRLRDVRVAGGGLVTVDRPVSTPWALLGLAEAASALARAAPVGLEPRPGADAIDAAHRGRWLERPLTARRCRAAGAETLVSSALGPLLARRGTVLATGMQLLADLVHAHTLPPLEDDFLDMAALPPAILADTLLGAWVRHCARHDVPPVRVAPWPGGRRGCLTLRHDVDRRPEDGDFERLLDLEASRGVSASWYFMADRLDPPRMRRLAAAGHEIGAHSLAHATLDDEIRAIAGAAGGPVAGNSWHGSAADYWNGPLSARAAAAAGCLYTELQPSVADYPFAGFPVLAADGSVDIAEPGLIGLSFTATTDVDGRYRVARKPDLPRSAEAARHWIGAGRYLCILNHPDTAFDTLKAWLEALPGDAATMTAEAVAAWWRATHVRRFCTLTQVAKRPDERVYVLEARFGVAGLVVESGDSKWIWTESGNIDCQVDVSAAEPRRLVLQRRGE